MAAMESPRPPAWRLRWNHGLTSLPLILKIYRGNNTILTTNRDQQSRFEFEKNMSIVKYLIAVVMAFALLAPISTAFAGSARVTDIGFRSRGYGGGYRSYSRRSYGFGSRNYSQKITPKPGRTPDTSSHSTVTHEHYHHERGGMFSSPWFWLWMMPHNQQPSVVVVPQAQGGALPGRPATPATLPTEDIQNDEGPDVAAILLGLLILGILAFYIRSVWRNS